MNLLYSRNFYALIAIIGLFLLTGCYPQSNFILSDNISIEKLNSMVQWGPSRLDNMCLAGAAIGPIAGLLTGAIIGQWEDINIRFENK